MIQFFIFTNFIKAQYDDLLIDYDNGINSGPLLTEKNEILNIKRKLASLNQNINSIIQDKLNYIISERFYEINKTLELLNIELNFQIKVKIILKK